jgi:hypothetical protein
MKLYTVGEILKKLDNCIQYKIPFSHIRYGDGGIKFIHSILYNDNDQLAQIIRREGLPKYNINEIFELWGYYSRQADCIDTPEVYFDGKFWPRRKKPGKPINDDTHARMIMWRELYDRAEFDNENYCNPESNYLMVLNIPGRKNLFDIMKNRKTCVITVFPEVKEVLHEYDIDIIKIVGHNQNQYKNSYHEVIDKITHKANDYDLWLVAAGELGRIYTGHIKECGGRAIDIGFVIEYWLSSYIHPRLYGFVASSLDNKLEMKLTREAERKYLKHI